MGVTERDGKVLVYCYAGCVQAEVIAALRCLGLWASERSSPGATARREHERAVDENKRVRRRDRWIQGVRELDAARACTYLRHALLRDDPGERDPRTTTLLHELGDPYLRELVAEQRLDEIERTDRAARKEVRDGRLPRRGPRISVPRPWAGLMVRR